MRRFILLTSPRTGSTLVTAALNAHPAVVMYGELFSPDEGLLKAQQTAKAPRRFAPAEDYYHEGADPVAFLEQYLYGYPFLPEKTAAGFKLFYAHLRTGPAAAFWDWLAGARDVHIIHLYRRRLLEAYVSYQIALRTREWLVPAAAGAHAAVAAPLRVDVEQFRRYVDEQRRYREEAETRFRGHPLLTIEYQADVCEHFDPTIRKIEGFLGVASMPLPKRLQKQAQLPVSEEVANFGELHDALEGTAYENSL